MENGGVGYKHPPDDRDTRASSDWRRFLTVAFNGDGTLLLANVYRAALIFDAGTGRCLRELPVKKGSACTCTVFSPDFARVLVGTARHRTSLRYPVR